MLGDIGNDFAFIFTNMYLMIFYTKVWGIDASVVGILFLVSRILDAFTDITMGRIVDKSKPTKDGRFRPWLKRMSGPFAISTFLMYQSALAPASMTVKIVCMFATYILWGSIFYTAINIPYGSMASVISDVPEHRASLSTFRNLGATFSGLIVGILAPQVIYYQDASGNQIINPTNFTIIAGVFSILAFICYYSCYKMSTERVKVEVRDENGEKVSIIKNLGTLFKNKALLSTIATTLFILLAGFVSQTMNQYLFVDYFKNVNALSLLSVVGMPVGLISAMFSVKLASKFGKKEVSVASILFIGAVLVITYFLKIKNPWVYIGIYTVGQLGNMMYSMLVWANIADVIDYNEITTGKRDDGTVYGIYSFSRKLGQALAGGVGGFALSFIGYNSASAIQTVAVTDGIYMMSTLFVGALFVIAGVIFLITYPLNKKTIDENTEKLRAMHNTEIK